MVLAVFEFFGFVQNSCFSLCLFRLIFLFEKSLVPKYLQCLALKEKSIIFIIVATKSTKLLQNEKLKVFFFFSAARSFRNSNTCEVLKKINKKNYLKIGCCQVPCHQKNIEKTMFFGNIPGVNLFSKSQDLYILLIC